MIAILFVLAVLAVFPAAAWHFLGYFNGRYTRWSQEQEARP